MDFRKILKMLFVNNIEEKGFNSAFSFLTEGFSRVPTKTEIDRSWYAINILGDFACSLKYFENHPEDILVVLTEIKSWIKRLEELYSESEVKA